MDVSLQTRHADQELRSGKISGGVQSITRALALLEALAENDEGLTLTSLARKVSLPASSAHRLLTTLQRRRFVRFDQATMAWQIGVQAFVVGNAFARTRDVGTLAKPYMRRLMEETGETVNLYVLTGGDAVICMAQVQCNHTVRAISRPGGAVRMHGSAAGKAVLAYMGRPEVVDITKRQGMQRATPNTIVSLRKLHVELAKTRQRGFAIDDEEFAVGLRCVAAPIFDERGVAHAALSIAGPAARILDDRLLRLGNIVGTAADDVTVELGGMATARQARAQSARGHLTLDRSA